MFLKLVLLLGLAIIHIFGNRMTFLQGIPRSIWLSIAGGASVAYVFVHLLPELQKVSQELQFFGLSHSVYFIALIGLCFIYGLEKIAKNKTEVDEGNVFWTHIFSYSIYNFIIGFLLISRPEEHDVNSLLLFFVAMGLHFFVDDYGLYFHHKNKYIHSGRWIVSGAVIFGGLVALATNLSQSIIYTALAFLTGGVIMNVLKEELPEERKSRYWAFFLGVAAYSVLLLFLTKAEE